MDQVSLLYTARKMQEVAPGKYTDMALAALGADYERLRRVNAELQGLVLQTIRNFEAVTEQAETMIKHARAALDSAGVEP